MSLRNSKYLIHPSDRAAIYKRDGYMCLYPGCTRTDLTIDHVIPLVKGGLCMKANYQTLCNFHNRAKGCEIADYRKKETVIA